MPDSSEILIDFHDVIYDVSGWYKIFARNLSQIGVETQFLESLEFDPFPASESLGETYRQHLNRFLKEIGLNSGQAGEFARTIEFQYSGWIQNVKLFPGINQALTRARLNGSLIGFLAEWESEQPLDVFLKRMGLLVFPDRVEIHSRNPHEFESCLSKIVDADLAQGTVPVFVSRNRQKLHAAAKRMRNCLGLGIDPRTLEDQWKPISNLSQVSPDEGVEIDEKKNRRVA